jgi:glycosyltransferase involved in cell wall biosynthesis
MLPGRPRVVIRESNLPSQALPALRHHRLIGAGYRVLYPTAAAIVCQSQAIAGELVRDFGVRPERAVLVRNPVDVEGIRERATNGTRAPGSGVRFVAAGHLIPQKGFDRLLEMFARLSADAQLVIYGDGAERGSLEEQRHRLGLDARVHMPGFVGPELWPALAGADCFVMPSRWEGMPNAALEALACGTPVLATPEAGGLTEVAVDSPLGAVTLAPIGGWEEALRRVTPRADTRLRPSLLPAEFALRQAVQALERVLG